MDVPTSNLDIEMNTCITINYVGQLKKNYYMKWNSKLLTTFDYSMPHSEFFCK